MPEIGREKGFKAMGICIVSNTRIDDHLEGGSRITYETKRKDNF